MVTVSVGLDVGLEKFGCPWPWEKSLGLGLGLVSYVLDNKTDWYHIDYVLATCRFWNAIYNAKILPDSDTCSHHNLVATNVKVKLKKVIKVSKKQHWKLDRLKDYINDIEFWCEVDAALKDTTQKEKHGNDKCLICVWHSMHGLWQVTRSDWKHLKYGFGEDVEDQLERRSDKQLSTTKSGRRQKYTYRNMIWHVLTIELPGEEKELLLLKCRVD